MKPNNETEERLQSQTIEEGEEREMTTNVAQDRGETNRTDNKNITPKTTMNSTDRGQGKTEDEKRGEGNNGGSSKASESNMRQTDGSPSRQESGSLEAEDAREKQWNTHYGDRRTKRRTDDADTIRFGTYNINTFPKLGSVRSRRLRQEMQDLDCAGMSELNKNWYKVNTQDSFRRRIDEWWTRHKTRHTWLRDFDWTSEYQQGGVSISTIGRIAEYSQEKGEDPSGLGRWCWQKLEGHSRIKTAVFQIYRPVKNTQDFGSTFIQQRATAGVPDPITIFDKDLLKQVDEFMVEDFQIVIMGDFNTYLNGRGKLEKELNQRGIKDIIQQRYGREEAPNTHVRGTKPIDGILASESIHMLKGGYEEGMSEISDHRMVWADLALDTVLGEDRGEMVRPKGKKLQLSNTKRTEKFNKTFRAQMRQHKTLEKATKLDTEIGQNKPMTLQQKRQYEAIYEQRERATRHAENKCAKLPATKDPFSPELQRALGKCVIMQAILKKRRKGARINKRWLIEIKRRWDITSHIDIPNTVEEARGRSNEAHEEYRAVQKKSPELRNQFLDHLIQEATDNGNDKKMRALRMIKEREQTRDVHARIKLARGVLRGGGVRFVHVGDNKGNVRTIQDKYEMEKEIMKANEAKLHSADESPVRQGELAARITDNDYD